MMNYLGYLRKRNPAGTPRRTLSHFLVCDSEKKSVLANTFSDLFFAPPCRISSLARGNGKNCAASPRLFFFLFGCPFFPMLTHGVLGVVPRLRRSLPRRAKRRDKSVPAGAMRARGKTRPSRPPRARERNKPTGTPRRDASSRPHILRASGARSRGVPRSLGEAAQSPRGSEARGLLFAAHPRLRRAPTRSRASFPQKKSVPAPA